MNRHPNSCSYLNVSDGDEDMHGHDHALVDDIEIDVELLETLLQQDGNSHLHSC